MMPYPFPLYFALVVAGLALDVVVALCVAAAAALRLATTLLGCFGLSRLLATLTALTGGALTGLLLTGAVLVLACAVDLLFILKGPAITRAMLSRIGSSAHEAKLCLHVATGKRKL